MKRGNINKEDVYKNFGWKYEDGDYKIDREDDTKKSSGSGFKSKLKHLIEEVKKAVKIF